MEEQGFHFSGGRKAGNVAELREILDSFNQLEFESYVNANKNDFVNWLQNSLGEIELANKVGGYYELEDFKRIIDDHLNPSMENDDSNKTEEEKSVEEEVKQNEAVRDFDESVNVDDKNDDESSDSVKMETEKEEIEDDRSDDESSDSVKMETEKEEIEDEVKALIEKNKEITKSIQDEKKNFKPAPKFAGHTLSHPFSKEYIKHLLYGFGFGIIIGAIIVFILMNAGVL